MGLKAGSGCWGSDMYLLSFLIAVGLLIFVLVSAVIGFLSGKKPTSKDDDARGS